MPLAIVALCGFAFGAADQYLGSLIALGPSAATVSGVSASWLVLPFIAGWTQTRPRRAVLVGALTVCAALLGYFAMTVSPFEGVPASRLFPALMAMARANRLWIAAGLVTAPLYGMLGHRWRRGRSWTSAALLAGCVCLEPAARWASGRLPPPRGVWVAEIALGLCVGAYCLVVKRRRRALHP